MSEKILNVTTEVPAEIYQLMNLSPQAAQRRPSVQYLPPPYPPRPVLPEHTDRKA